MSKNTGCRACQFYARGGKSRIPMEHTCGQEPQKKKLVKADGYMLDRKASNLIDNKMQDMIFNDVNQFSRDDIKNMSEDKAKNILSMIEGDAHLFSEPCWKELALMIKDEHMII